ncbi:MULTISPECIES: DUF305 domain-containing protein [Pseudomonas]|uniref:DUF305 domain-containing protein n=1 Tax=Pseudomonas gregormendelii TaxID=1628277 RepID=A0ABS3ANJ5_9PSED|nr:MULTISPECIES: DUF305 domain-containing protein [Pseudomonas]MBN3968520.1 DUF305 domain-containing protein [Pseudomonas gregormendelii]MDI3358148.1 DUF305 domain-containing protein [Pseudomonas sp. UYIF39]
MPIFLAHKIRISFSILALIAAFPAIAHEATENADPSNHSSLGTPFLSENNVAMERMMKGMEVEPTGDVDHDFVIMMSAHHQGAIDMAMTLLKYGKNEQLRRLAQEIIVEQQQEIAAMKLAIGAPLPASVASPSQTPSVAQP